MAMKTVWFYLLLFKSCNQLKSVKRDETPGILFITSFSKSVLLIFSNNVLNLSVDISNLIKVY